MKTLYMIAGTMGVGKTTVCQELKRMLPRAVFLDGDWCWDADPFQVTEETKEMVQDNITHTLQNFLRCTAYENVIFGWVMHQEEIMAGILSRLDTAGCRVEKIALVCTPEALRERILRDVERGIRRKDVLDRSLERLPLYEALSAWKLDVSGITPEEAARRIMERKV